MIKDKYNHIAKIFIPGSLTAHSAYIVAQQERMQVCKNASMKVFLHFGGEKTSTPVHDPKSFDTDSVQVGKEIYTTLGIEPRTYSNPGRSRNHYSVLG